MKKIVFYVMTHKGLVFLRHAIKVDKKLIKFVVISKDSSLKNDYSRELINLSKKHKLNFYMRGSEPKVLCEDYIFAVSWRWMINHKITKLIVFHDSLLPKYRGFAPLINMLINGENEIGVSAVFGAKEYDKGNVIAKQKTKINYPIKIREAIRINNKNYIKLLEELFNKINSNEELKGIPQIEADATYSIWRNQEDFFIDWSRNSNEIKRFVDALDFPYSGAMTKTSNGDIIRILNVDIVKDVICEIRHVGKVIFCQNGLPVVICGNGLLRITKAYITINNTEISYLPLNTFKVKFL